MAEEYTEQTQRWQNTFQRFTAANKQRQSGEVLKHLEEVERKRQERGWRSGRLSEAYTGGQFTPEEEELQEAAAARRWQEELESSRRLQAAAAASSSSSSKWQEAPGDEEPAQAAVEDPPDWGDKATEDGQPPYFAN